MIASKEKAEIPLESHMRGIPTLEGSVPKPNFEALWRKFERKFGGSLKQTASKLPPAPEEVSRKLPRNFHRHQRKFRGSFLETSSPEF